MLCCRGSSIKTRIETTKPLLRRTCSHCLGCRGSSIKTRIETYPYTQKKKQAHYRCRGSSIKTRIETYVCKYVSLRYKKGCRGSSIKTRIETYSQVLNALCDVLVAEVVPLKQGLKHLKKLSS